jgi:type IV pilus assembly protein PilV
MQLRQNNNQRGSSLIEVMVSLTILAIGIVGMAQLQNQAAQANHSAYLFSQATFLADDLAERMRTNSASASSYTVDIGDSLSGVSLTQCETGSCTAAELALWDVKRWKEDLAESLPQGDGSIALDVDTYTITTQFDESRGDASVAPAKVVIQGRF